MHAVEIIEKKRDGLALSREEITWFIEQYTANEIPDYQAAAFCMATLFRGMNAEEVTALTLAMAHSGDVLDLSGDFEYVVDKHSSGGVGDKTSLVVLPLVASMGVPVAKMSGRGLGLTGGTLDKLEAIAGFSSSLSEEALIQQAKDIGLALGGQTRDLAPADGKLYALRDVTGTVSSLPLIASSIMSKKLAAGAHGIVLDVKVGSGAFMHHLDDARALAETMVTIGRNAGRDMIALISDMNQPLGHAVGNAVEVFEAVDTLKGGGPEDFREHCLTIAAYMLQLAGRRKGGWQNLDATREQLTTQLRNGKAFDKFLDMVHAQGGDIAMVRDTSKLPRAGMVEMVKAEKAGYISQVAADKIARAAFVLGAGREKKGDTIDQAVGVLAYVKVGDKVEAGQTIAAIHANKTNKMLEALAYVEEAIHISVKAVEPLPLFYDVIVG